MSQMEEATERQKGHRGASRIWTIGLRVCPCEKAEILSGPTRLPHADIAWGPKIGAAGHVALSTSQKVQFMYRARVEADRTLPRVGGEVDGARGVANGRSDRTEKGADGDTYSLGNWHSIVAL